MSWRDQLQQGKFRDAEFLWSDTGLTFGRRTARHEYPKRDKPFIEDLGRRAREFTLEIYVLEPDYMIKRDRLLAAIEQPGPGTLIHPTLGAMQVSIIDPRLSESTRDGGMAKFSITCIEAGEKQFPSVTVDTATAVVTTTDTTLQSAINDFANTFSVLGQAEYFVTEIQNELDNVLSSIESIVGDITSPIAAVIRTPFNMASAIVGAIGEIGNQLQEPGDALNLYRNLFDAGSDSQAVPLTTANRKQQATNQEQLHWLVRRSAIAEACRTSSSMHFESSTDALTLRDLLIDAIDTQLESTSVVDGTSIDDDVFGALTDLRANVARDLDTRGAQLPRLQTYTPNATLPASVIAHTLYGDATRANEIIVRNNIRHPGFVLGGHSLEVLSDAG